MADFLSTLQRRLLPGVAARGRALASSGGVELESQASDEIFLRVRGTRAGLSLRVSLWPEDEDYHCECEEQADPCSHVAAALFALESGAKAAARITYHALSEPSTRGASNLKIERRLGEKRIDTPLSALEGVLYTETDLKIERLLDPRLGPRRWDELFVALKEAGGLTLDGAPVKIGKSEVLWRASLHETESARGRGYRLKLFFDPEISKEFESGVVLRGEELLVSKDPGLLEREKELLGGEGVFVSIHDEGRLFGEILPALEKKIPIERHLSRAVEQRRSQAQSQGLLSFDLREDGERLVAVARIEGGTTEEQRQLLRKLQIEFQMAPGQALRLQGMEAMEWTERLLDLAQKDTELLRVTGPGVNTFRREKPLTLELDWSFESSNWISLSLSSSHSQVSGERVLRAWQEGDSYLRLPQGGFAPLPLDWLTRYGPTLQRMLALKQTQSQEGRVRVPAYFESELRAQDQERGTPRAESFTPVAPAPWIAPPDLLASLRDYQREGVQWLHEMKASGKGGILADDMGLGKTLQALCVVERGTLVVCPTSVLESWREQAEQFRPGLKVQVYSGASRQLPKSSEQRADLTLTSYAILRLDAETLASQDWSLVILDEAQTIKNPDSQVSRAARRLCARARLALSGTPVENRLEDLWSQMDFLNPGLLGSREEFRTQWAAPIERGLQSGDATQAARLHQRTQGLILRRLKKQVAKELPPKTEAVLHCELSPRERDLYAAIQAATRAEVLEQLESGENLFGVLEQLLRLRQASCHPDLLSGPFNKAEAAHSSKTEVWMESLESSLAQGHRALVFSQWTSFLDLLEPLLQEKKIGYLRLDGSTPNRGAVVAEFQSSSGPPVLLLSLKAGGVGITLTAADHVYLMDSWWNPAVEDQATDRAYRIGQDKPVFVYRLVARETVEEKILALQAKKRVLSGGVLTREELLELLN